jgi:hypothetical protein
MTTYRLIAVFLLAGNKGLGAPLPQESPLLKFSFAPAAAKEEQQPRDPLHGSELSPSQDEEAVQVAPTRTVSFSDVVADFPELYLTAGEGEFDGIAQAHNLRLQEPRETSDDEKVRSLVDRGTSRGVGAARLFSRRRRASNRGFASRLPPYKDSNKVFEENFKGRKPFSRPLASSSDKNSKTYFSAYDPLTANHIKENTKFSFRG